MGLDLSWGFLENLTSESFPLNMEEKAAAPPEPEEPTSLQFPGGDRKGCHEPGVWGCCIVRVVCSAVREVWGSSPCKITK